MSEFELKAFLQAVSGDEALQHRLAAAADPDAEIKIAKTMGFIISADDLREFKESSGLSDEDLEKIAGGKFDWTTLIP